MILATNTVVFLSMQQGCRARATSAAAALGVSGSDPLWRRVLDRLSRGDIIRAALGDPEWAADPALDDRAGRRRAHDRIDERLREWTRSRDRSELAAELRALGIPASEVADPCRLLETNPQLRSRGYFEALPHPVVGAMPLPSLPFRYESVERWLRTPAPTMGQDNERVLRGILGLSADALRDLAAEGVIGTRPEGL